MDRQPRVAPSNTPSNIQQGQDRRSEIHVVNVQESLIDDAVFYRSHRKAGEHEIAIDCGNSPLVDYQSRRS